VTTDTVIIISANAEWKVVKDHMIPGDVQNSPFGEFFQYVTPSGKEMLFFHGGWGKISAAASTQYVIDCFHPRYLINIGTCGGIYGRVERGTIILVTETIVYDIVEKMGDYDAHIQAYTTKLDLSFLRMPYPTTVLAALMVSGDRDLSGEDIPWLIDKFGAIAVDWESGAIAYVAARNQVPLLILRGVSDLVSESGGEAYGNLEFFENSARDILTNLTGSLETWIGCFA
jgi:adenosylhomocysteine nucleosidase